MSTFYIPQGRDIKIKGVAAEEITEKSLPSYVAIQPSDFRGIKSKLLVKVGDEVKVGTPVIQDKNFPEIKIVSPASGKVSAVNRGEKRALQSIVVQTDGQQESIKLQQFSQEEINNFSESQIVEHLLRGGLWPCVRQRPFSKVAHPIDVPKSIFIQGMNSEPLAPDIDFILDGKEDQFQAGLDIIRHLTRGKVYLCVSDRAQSKALTQSQHVVIHRFAGPHPAGNVGTHIHHIDPINKGDLVWYIGAQDVLRIATLFFQGEYSPERYVAVTGEGVVQRHYAKTIMGASLKSLIDEESKDNMRYLSGSILTGQDVGSDGFLCFYDEQVTVVPQGGSREFFGWLSPGLYKYSFSKTFLSSLNSKGNVSLSTSVHGSNRAIVFNDIYDNYVPLDIMVYFLLKAILANDIEEAEKLGILECDEEDFALCSFACPSKINIGAIIRQGLDLIEKEG